MIEREVRDTRSIAYELSGVVTNTWAMVDQCVDLMLLRTIWCFQPISGKIPQIKWGQLSTKLQNLAQICQEHPALVHDEPILSPLCKEATELYESRNDLIHGMVSSFGKPEIVVTRWKGSKNRIRLWSTQIPLQDLMDFAVQSKKLAESFHRQERRWAVRWTLPPDAIISEPNG